MDDAPGSNDEQAIRHVNKRARKAKGSVAVFDESARRDFVTGFRKRKQQRRKQAEKENIEKERKKRIQIRKEKRIAEQARLAEAAGNAQLRSAEADDVISAGGDVAGDLAEEDEPGARSALEDVLIYDDTAAVTTVVIKDLGNEGSEDAQKTREDAELLEIGKARLREKNKRNIGAGQSLKSEIKKRLAHKAHNRKGHNKKAKNSNKRKGK